MNAIIVAGHVGNVETRNSNKGQPMLLFSVADNHYIDGERTTTWWRCKLWGQRAGRLAPLIRKGTYVCCSGRLCPDDYTDKSGKEHKAWQVWVDQMDIKNEMRMDKPVQHDKSVVPLTDEDAYYEDPADEDDIPF